MDVMKHYTWLLDKAARANDHSYARMLNQTASMLKQLSTELEMARAERDAVTRRMLELEQRGNNREP